MKQFCVLVGGSMQTAVETPAVSKRHRMKELWVRVTSTAGFSFC